MKIFLKFSSIFLFVICFGTFLPNIHFSFEDITEQTLYLSEGESKKEFEENKNMKEFLKGFFHSTVTFHESTTRKFYLVSKYYKQTLHRAGFSSPRSITLSPKRF